MSLKIVESLEGLLRDTPEVQSILILDRDGVPVVSAGTELRNKTQLSQCYTSSMEHAKKLGMGSQLFWVFQYESSQLVLLNLEPFLVYVLAAPTADTGTLCDLGTPLLPILKECELVMREVVGVAI